MVFFEFGAVQKHKYSLVRHLNILYDYEPATTCKITLPANMATMVDVGTPKKIKHTKNNAYKLEVK